MTVTVEVHGKKWTKHKGRSYYQCTSNIEGKRPWLHRYTYEVANGVKIPKGYDIHHKDEDTDNNEPGNLEMICSKAHVKHHYEEGHKPHFYVDREKTVELAKLAKQGKYVGIDKRRKIEHARDRVCEECGSTFKLKEKDRNDTKYCTKECSKRARGRRRNSEYVPEGEQRPDKKCPTCGESFTPSTGHQLCCSRVCYKKYARANEPTEDRSCKECGEVYTVKQSSTKEFCRKQCATNYNKVECECIECGTTFKGTTKGPKWCTPECRYSWNKKNNAEKGRKNL